MDWWKGESVAVRESPKTECLTKKSDGNDRLCLSTILLGHLYWSYMLKWSKPCKLLRETRISGEQQKCSRRIGWVRKKERRRWTSPIHHMETRIKSPNTNNNNNNDVNDKERTFYIKAVLFHRLHRHGTLCYGFKYITHIHFSTMIRRSLPGLDLFST